MSSASLKESFRYVQPTYPLQPGSYLCINTTPWKNGAGHTFPHGLAIKLGMIPCVMPTLFAVYLNKIALSAILRAEVYASAVSRTPGPVSVSVPWKIPLTFYLSNQRKRLTMAFYGNLEFQALVEEIMEVLVVKLRSK